MPAASGVPPPVGSSASRALATSTVPVGPEHDLGRVAAEGHEGDAVTALVGVEQQAEHRALRRRHASLGPHRARGVDRQDDQVAGALLAYGLAQVARPRPARPRRRGRRPARIVAADGHRRRRRPTAPGRPRGGRAGLRGVDRRPPAGPAVCGASRRATARAARGLGDAVRSGCSGAARPRSRACVELLLGEPGSSNGMPAPAVGQRERRDPADVVDRWRRRPGPQPARAAAARQITRSARSPSAPTDAHRRLTVCNRSPGRPAGVLQRAASSSAPGRGRTSSGSASKASARRTASARSAGSSRRVTSAASPKRSRSWGRRSPSSGFIDPTSTNRLGVGVAIRPPARPG